MVWVVVGILVLIILVVSGGKGELRSKIDSLNTELLALKGSIETRARDLQQQWAAKQLQDLASAQAQNMFEAHRIEWEAGVRADAIKRSGSTISGKVTEHLAPFLQHFPYNPKDVRFIGAPIDLLVFDGMSDEKLREIVFVEIKTGESADLSTRERTIRDCIAAKCVSFRVVRHDGVLGATLLEKRSQQTQRLDGAAPSDPVVELATKLLAGRTLRKPERTEPAPAFLPPLSAQPTDFNLDWEAVLARVSAKRMSLAAMLRSCRVSRVNGNLVVVQLPADCNQVYLDRLNEADKRTLLEEALSGVVGRPLVACFERTPA